MPDRGLQRDRAALHAEWSLDVLVPEMSEVTFAGNWFPANVV